MALDQLVHEAVNNNPELKAALHQMASTDALVPQAGSLDGPELKFMREMMPDFRYNDAMYSRIELMQMFPFPGKLAAKADLAQIVSDHSHHEYFEKLNEVISRLKEAYDELWFVQQSIHLNAESASLLREVVAAVRTRFGVGTAEQQEVFRTLVEIAKTENQGIVLRQKELSAKAMLTALLNRSTTDTLGTATLPPLVPFALSLDTLQVMALQSRPMLLHDSLRIEENRLMLSIARKDYLPDFTVGLERVTSPMTGFNGWSVSASMTIPFAPWSIGKTNARVEEAQAAVSGSVETYNASKNMVASTVSDLYYRLRSAERQLDLYRSTILPQAEASLQASLTAYQNGRSDFLMLLDASRMLVDLKMESLMLRMQYEQTTSQLERAVGFEHTMHMQ